MYERAVVQSRTKLSQVRFHDDEKYLPTASHGGVSACDKLIRTEGAN